jgi:hypothetical protein
MTCHAGTLAMCVYQEGLYLTCGVLAFSVTFSLMMVVYMPLKYVGVKVIL